MSKEQQCTVKKIGLIGCIATGIGTIIGSGIFGSLPEVINSIGAGAIPALIVAVIYIIACLVPNMFASSVIPATGSFFLYQAKLIHPIAGLFMAIQNLLLPVLVSVFAVLFSDYFVALFPALDGRQIIISVILLLIYTGIAWFGNYTFVSINNIMVVTLLIAIGIYVVIGVPNMNPGQLVLSDLLMPGIKLTSFSAAVGILSSSLSGAGSISQIANDVKNPRRNLPIAMILSPVLVCGVYILMAVVSLGAMEGDKITTLSDVASQFMSPGLITFFIVGGPLCGVLTSMVPQIMLSVASVEAAADSGVYPEVFCKRNKHNVPVWILVYVMAFAVICVVTGAGFGILMTVFSFVNTLSNLLMALVPFYLYKKYPHACNYAGFKMNRAFTGAVSIFAVVASAYLSFTMLSTLGMTVWILVGAGTVASIVYFILRIKWLKARGIDLLRSLEEPYSVWEEREAECRRMDEAK